MIINHNMNSMNAYRNVDSLVGKQRKSMEKLNSGLRINRARDDVAGLSISEKMRSQIRGLNESSRNAQAGISMIQTAEVALSETQSIGQRMRELALQSANGTYTDENRKLINEEFQNLKKEIDRIANDTEFSGSKVLNGDRSGRKIEQKGTGNITAGGGTGGTITPSQIGEMFKLNKPEELRTLGEGKFTIKGKVENGNLKLELIDESRFNGFKKYVMDSQIIYGALKDDEVHTVKLANTEFKIKRIKDKLGNGGFNEFSIDFENSGDKVAEGMELQVGANQDQLVGFSIDFMRSRELGLGGLEIGTAKEAQEAIESMSNAIDIISEQRSLLGAAQNRLEYIVTSTNNTAENLQAAESRIRDVDMAKEMMSLTKLNVLQQASQAMLSQANQAPMQVVSMLK